MVTARIEPYIRVENKHFGGGVVFTAFKLLPEKCLQFDWLRAEVCQLDLEYLHVKITVTIKIISLRELHKNGGKNS